MNSTAPFSVTIQTLALTRFRGSPKPWRLALQLFVNNRTEIPERRMATHPVIKALHKLEESLSGLPSSSEGSAFYAFPLECPEERLRDGIVITVACTAIEGVKANALMPHAR